MPHGKFDELHVEKKNPSHWRRLKFMAKIIDFLFIKRFIEIRYCVEIQFVTIIMRHQVGHTRAIQSREM